MWKCPSCNYAPKQRSKLRYPITCRCGERDYGRPNDHTIEWCDDPRGAAPRCGLTPNHDRRRGGPGTELKKKLWWFGYLTKRGCKCNRHARQMDREGPDWCEQNIGLIVENLRQSYEDLPNIVKTFVPFVDPVVRHVVIVAIEASRSTASCHTPDNAMGQAPPPTSQDRKAEIQLAATGRM